jgi:hypothetical protein
VDGLWLRFWPPPPELSGDVPEQAFSRIREKATDDVGLVLDVESG